METIYSIIESSDNIIGDILRYFPKAQFGKEQDGPRVVFYMSEHNAHRLRRSPGVEYLNGLVIDIFNKRVLSIPPRLLHKSMPRRMNINNYTVYPIIDGTVINAYYYDDAWQFGTTRAFDIMPYTFVNDIKYRDAIHEVMQGAKLELDSLDTTCCYTFIFRHPLLHPLKQDPQNMWYVGGYKLTTGEPLADNPTSLKMQMPLDEQVSLGVLENKCRKSVVQYNKFGEINYGYILRNRDPQYGDIIVQSELHKLVQEMVYDMPKSTYGIIDDVNTPAYLALKSLLKGSGKLYQKLFPQYAHFIDEYKFKIRESTKLVIELLKSDDLVASYRLRAKEEPLTPAETIAFNTYSEMVSTNLRQEAETGRHVRTKLGGYDKNTSSVVENMISAMKNIDILYAYFGPKK